MPCSGQACGQLTSPGVTPASDDGESDEEQFVDPVTGNLMVDPVLCSDGQTYDRCVDTLGCQALKIETSGVKC